MLDVRTFSAAIVSYMVVTKSAPMILLLTLEWMEKKLSDLI